MALVHTTTIRNGLADLVVDAIDQGAGAGKVQITKTNNDYTGVNLLAEVTLADPAFGAAASGTAAMAGAPKEDSSANNTGTAVQFRVVDSTDTEIFKGTVTATGGGGDMELSSTSITSGDAVRINSFTYSACP